MGQERDRVRLTCPRARFTRALLLGACLALGGLPSLAAPLDDDPVLGDTPPSFYEPPSLQTPRPREPAAPLAPQRDMRSGGTMSRGYESAPDVRDRKRESLTQAGPLALLSGCWEPQNRFKNSQTGEVIVPEYCFNEKGIGQRIMRGNGGKICTGKLVAHYERDWLVLNSQPAVCPNSKEKFAEERAICQSYGGIVICRGSQENRGSLTTWQSTMRRKRR